MIIEEIFYAIQGEGIFAGVPSVFVRMEGEPARGTWCTPSEKHWKPDPGELRFGPVLSAIRKHYCGHAVLIGDEPLNDPDIGALTGLIRTIDHFITIETSGAVFAQLECDLMSITPRLVTASGRKSPGRGYNTEAIRQLISAYPYQLKFAVSKREEMEEVKNLTDELGAERTRVLLMPAGTKAKDLKEQTEWVLEACRFFGYRFSPRLQLMSPAEKKTAGPMR
jgi:7-carboxy-7-deazaguanine synthase